MSGRHLDCFLNKILFEKRYEFNTPLDLELISEIKEKLYVLKLDSEFKPHRVGFKNHPLLDDLIVRLITERYSITEAIFDRKRIGLEKEGFHESVFKSILKSNSDMKNEIFSKVVLAGRNISFEKF